MLDFTYYTPSKVYFGKGKEKEVGEIIRGYGFKKIMMQYGMSSIKKSGLYDTVMTSLRNAGIEVVEMGGIEPNPKLSFVYKAIEVARREGVELILSVGGGSVLDSSKATANGVLYEGDVWDLFERKAVSKGALPVACILTHSAAGSEMSASCVITNMETNMKRGMSCDYNRCLFSILNPELTFSVSKYQTACGIVDIMMHTLERYFTVCPETPLTDRIAESILKSVCEAGKVVINEPENYDARATIMWASSLSHNDLTSCGRINALAVHQLEHALSGEYDEIAHGAGLAVLFPAWARLAYKNNPKRFANLARAVFDITEKDDEKAAVLGIDALSAFFKEIGMPQKISEFGVPKEAIFRLAELCTFGKTRTVNSLIELDYDKIVEIFENAF